MNQYGWIEYLVQPELMEWAMERCKQMDAEAEDKPDHHVRSYATREDRAAGIAAEQVFAGWLDHRQVYYERHGGVDRYPDFEVNGHAVAVKMCGSRIAFSRSHLVHVFDAHLPKFEQWFFIGFERAASRMWLLGGASWRDFRARANVGEKGQTIVRGFTCTAPLWYAPTTALKPPLDWLDGL